MNGYANILQNGFRTDFWKKYEDTINCLTLEQKEFVSKQKNVIEAKNVMYANFVDYLFETQKDAFVSIADGKNKEIVNKYIDEIKKAADSYVSKNEQLEKENAELREQLKIILGERNNVESMAADGSRRVRENNYKKNVRQGNDTGNNCDFSEDTKDRS